LSIVWGFLPQYHWKVSCTILIQFIPLLLGESLLQYHWNVLYTAHALFIPYCLENFCSHFILGRLVSCTCRSLATFLLGPSTCFFCLECLLCAGLTLSSFGTTLLLPVQLGAPFWSIIGLHHPYSNLVEVFLLDAFLFVTLFWASLQGHHFVGFPPSILQLVGVIFWMCFLDLPICFGHLLRVTTSSFPFILAPADWSYLLDTFLRFAHLLRRYLSSSLEP